MSSRTTDSRTAPMAWILSLLHNLSVMKYDIIIIGAGAAGLMAMKELLADGYRVCMLEAAPNSGGRIMTLKEKGFKTPVEAGAEFIHGNLPLTLSLLQYAGIPFEPVEGKMITVHKGEWDPGQEHEEHWAKLMKTLRKLKKDMTIRTFLGEYFPGTEYKELREATRRFAEGFDLADTGKASILSVRKEWEHEEQMQYRIPGGYCQLTDYLLRLCRRRGGKIYFNSCARNIHFEKGKVLVKTRDKLKFEASRLIVTVSAGVLRSGMLHFNPGLGAHQAAIRQLGFGSVIKFLLQFKNPFWKGRGIGFLFSDEPIPTWWTQRPEKNNLLTGWLGGPAAAKMSSEKEGSLLQLALGSLASLFQMKGAELKSQLSHYKIIRWEKQPYILGGYSYNTIYSEKAIEVLTQPVEDTIFFAGEALYTGEFQGTVEAALQTGLEVAKKIRKMDK